MVQSNCGRCLYISFSKVKIYRQKMIQFSWLFSGVIFFQFPITAGNILEQGVFSRPFFFSILELNQEIIYRLNISVFSQNTRKYGLEKTRYLHTILAMIKQFVSIILRGFSIARKKRMICFST